MMSIFVLLTVVKKPVDEKVEITTQRVAEEKLKQAEGNYCLITLMFYIRASSSYCYLANMHMLVW